MHGDSCLESRLKAGLVYTSAKGFGFRGERTANLTLIFFCTFKLPPQRTPGRNTSLPASALEGVELIEIKSIYS